MSNGFCVEAEVEQEQLHGQSLLKAKTNTRIIASHIPHTMEEGVSNLLIPCQITRPNSCRLMKSPITRSCICSVLEKQIVRRTNRLIRVRKLICLLSIFCVLAFPTVCFSASR